MKTSIAILGSTGSIGRSLIRLITKDKKNFQILLLTADKNYKELLKQAKIFKVKNIIITNKKSYLRAINENFSSNLNIFNDFNNFDEIFKKKADYTMSAISGLAGLIPTLNIIKYTKKIAIANKESLVCGWYLLNKEFKKFKTNFIPVDSEHFSIWYALREKNVNNIEKIFITASGGPFYKLPISKFKNINKSQALKHPNWKMGKKISVDSATMMNKVFEIIEAKNIFNIPYDKLEILTHPKSYVHAILKFNNGLIKIIAHDTTMDIPIFNTLYSNFDGLIKSKYLNIEKLNNLDLHKIDTKRYPLVNILKSLPNKSSLFETVIVSANDELVNLFLENKIKFNDISIKLNRFLKLKEFNRFKLIQPKKIIDIVKLNKYVRFKINTMRI